MNLLSQLPDNLLYKDGELSTKDGTPVADYLKSRLPSKPDQPPQPVVLVTRELFLKMVADHAVLERRRRAEEEERFPLAA